MVRKIIRGITGSLLTLCILATLWLVPTMLWGTEWDPLGAAMIMIMLVIPTFFIAGLIHLLAGNSPKDQARSTRSKASATVQEAGPKAPDPESA